MNDPIHPGISGIRLRTAWVLPAFLLLPVFTQAQNHAVEADTLFPDTLCKGRLIGVLSTQGTIYLGSLTGLYYLWYKDYPQSSFHFFIDDDEWLQMDKMGHMFSAYYLSSLMHYSYRWSGVGEKKAVWFGTLLSWAFMLNIEILDGFSAEWGFSPGDLAANTLGCALFTSQQLIWKEQRFRIKYSYYPSGYPKTNPELLGENFVQNLVKDYNGMTFWLSGNISAFLPRESKFPKWLNVSIGYGANGVGVPSPPYSRYRQFFLSLDVDLSRISTRSKTLKALFSVLNLIKIPFPALEYNTQGKVKFHPLYF